jgi:uncharacterized protein YidB (DUF937 family)
MGLLDILTGGGDPRGQQQGGGMNPIVMALLALLAGKVLGGGPGGAGGGPFGGGPFGGGPGGGRMPPGGMGGGPFGGGPGGGGGLGDLLGGLFGGAGGGSVLTGGLNDLLRQMERNGHGDAARTWVGRGENRRLSPAELDEALGPGTVDTLAEQAGIDRVGLLEGLSEQLPDVVDQLTPEGRLPTDEEAEGML